MEEEADFRLATNRNLCDRLINIPDTLVSGQVQAFSGFSKSIVHGPRRKVDP